MNIVLGTTPVGLTVFGGCVTEMSPEDLPEGASPFNMDCDYVPGSVFTRGGRQSVYTFNGLFVDDLAGFAISVPGPLAPNETAWATPLNATLNLPGAYASVSLNVPPSGGGSAPNFDKATNNAGSSATVTNSITPTIPGEAAFLFASAVVPGPGGGVLNPG